MLAIIGESPVVSVDVPIPEVTNALEVLHTVSLEVQSKGWDFNTDTGYPLSPGVDGAIAVPSNAIRVDASEVSASIQVRAGKLYDKANRSSIFTEAVHVDVVWFFEFEELPQPAKQYIYIKAARRFQREHLGSTTIEKLTEQDENESFVGLLDYETESADFNLLTGNQDNLRASLRI